jgi:hypothetical protein
MAGVEESWLGGLCEYSDPSDDLPPGGCHKIPLWGPEKAAYKWKIMDAEPGQSWKSVKPRG